MSVLSVELQQDPLSIGYAQWIPNSPGAIADLLNAPSFSMVKKRMVAELDVVGEYPTGPVDGDAVLTKLEVFSATTDPLASLVRRALKILSQSDGINIGDPSIQAMLDQLQQNNVLTSTEATSLKGLAIQPASRAEVLGLTPVTIEQVIEAL